MLKQFYSSNSRALCESMHDFSCIVEIVMGTAKPTMLLWSTMQMKFHSNSFSTLTICAFNFDLSITSTRPSMKLNKSWTANLGSCVQPCTYVSQIIPKSLKDWKKKGFIKINARMSKVDVYGWNACVCVCAHDVIACVCRKLWNRTRHKHTLYHEHKCIQLPNELYLCSVNVNVANIWFLKWRLYRSGNLHICDTKVKFNRKLQLSDPSMFAIYYIPSPVSPNSSLWFLRFWVALPFHKKIDLKSMLLIIWQGNILNSTNYKNIYITISYHVAL